MEKMTTDELAKALEMCTPNEVCATCSLPGGGSCAAVIRKNALDLTKRLRADLKQKDTEIDILIRKNARLKDEVSELRAEVERLQRHNKEYGFINLLGNCLVYSKNLKDYNDMRKGLKSEARKEFAERLKAKLTHKGKSTKYGDFTWDDITSYELDKLLAEMEERE